MNLTIASAEKSVLIQSIPGVHVVCVENRRCLKFGVTTLVHTLDRDLQQKKQKNKQTPASADSVGARGISALIWTCCVFALDVTLRTVLLYDGVLEKTHIVSAS